ncbi:MAG: hypothetical protein KGQ87_03860 [Verrucomicrobia bacterium]|nr:hypothetical protein [Verrucomicrobiota bacterium]
MKQFNPIAFTWAEAERRERNLSLAKAIRKKEQLRIAEWESKPHTVMEIIGDEPTGLIIEMLGADILTKNDQMLIIYLQEMSNWNSYSKDAKPRLRKFITPREFRLRKKNERNAIRAK